MFLPLFYVLIGCVIGMCCLILTRSLICERNFPKTIEDCDAITFIPLETKPKHDETVIDDPRPYIVLRQLVRNQIYSFIIAIIQQSNTTTITRYYRVFRGLPHDDIRRYVREFHTPISIFMNGYQPMEMIHFHPVRSILKLNFIPGILVSVGHPCDLWWNYRSFNYCGQQDVNSLAHIVDAITLHHEQTPLYLMGASKGGLTTLRYLSVTDNNKISKNIAAACIFSPIVDFESSSKGHGFVGKLLRFGCPYVMPNYVKVSLLDCNTFLPVPTFVSSLCNDAFVDVRIVQRVLTQHKHIVHFISKNHTLQHGEINKDAQHHVALLHFLNTLPKR